MWGIIVRIVRDGVHESYVQELQRNAAAAAVGAATDHHMYTRLRDGRGGMIPGQKNSELKGVI